MSLKNNCDFWFEIKVEIEKNNCATVQIGTQLCKLQIAQIVTVQLCNCADWGKHQTRVICTNSLQSTAATMQLLLHSKSIQKNWGLNMWFEHQTIKRVISVCTTMSVSPKVSLYSFRTRWKQAFTTVLSSYTRHCLVLIKKWLGHLDKAVYTMWSCCFESFLVESTD